MSLQTRLDELMAGVRTQVPAEVLAPVEDFYAQLCRTGRFPGAVTTGQPAPDFELPDATGKPVSLAALRRQGPVVISFYRGAWCPFCNLELRALQQALPQLRALGASLVAISPEQPDYSMPLIEREQLQFAVLSDAGNQVAGRFGLVFALAGEARRLSLEVFGVDLPRFNGDDSWTLPVPATYLVDRRGIVQLAHVDPEFRNRLEPATIVQALQALQAAR